MKYQQLVSTISHVSNTLQLYALQQSSLYLTIRNWLIGNYIIEFEQDGEDRAKYGSALLKNMALSFKQNNIKGLSFTNLKLFRQFYQQYFYLAETIHQQIQHSLHTTIQIPKLSLPQEQTELNRQIGQTPDFLPPQILIKSLTFSHFTELMRVSNPLKRLFYEVQTIKNNWTTRELSRQIASLLYERTGLSKDKATLIQQVKQQSETLQAKDIIKDPFVLEFTGLPQSNILYENNLEQALIDNLQDFLLELGKGFAFIARQYRMQIDNEHYYADLLFYHRFLKCLVVIELKTRAFKHADSSQLNMYLNYLKANEMQDDDNPPIGILLCTDKKENVVKYATSGMQNLFVSRYTTALPTESELQAFIETEKRHLGL